MILLKKQAARMLKNFNQIPARTICRTFKNSQIVDDLLSYGVEVKIKGFKAKL